MGYVHMNVPYKQLVRIFLLRGKHKVDFNLVNDVAIGQYPMEYAK